MYHNVRVIPHRVLRHKSGKQASIHGSAPWYSEEEAKDWGIETVGWTWECTDHKGVVTIGACRQPVSTKEEAEVIAASLLTL